MKVRHVPAGQEGRDAVISADCPEHARWQIGKAAGRRDSRPHRRLHRLRQA